MSDPINIKIKQLWTRFKSKPFRDAFVSSELHANIAAQITTLREDRAWTQQQLAEKAHMAQSRISLLENPSYDKTSLSTLRRIASAFDVGIAVRFVPFSDNLGWATDDAPHHLSVSAFSDDAMPNRGARGADWILNASVVTNSLSKGYSVSLNTVNKNENSFINIDQIVLEDKRASAL